MLSIVANDFLFRFLSRGMTLCPSDAIKIPPDYTISFHISITMVKLKETIKNKRKVPEESSERECFFR